jgi:hypothetical protein
MKWLGCGWYELGEIPSDVIEIVDELILKEANELENIRRNGDKEPEEDHDTLKKIVVDGKVIKRRELSPSEQALRQFFGGPPREKSSGDNG